MSQRIVAILLMLAVAGLLGAAEVKAVRPPGVATTLPFSPGLVVGKMLYVSGQGAKDAKLCLEAVKTVITAAGLTMDHVVYAQVYVTDPAGYAEIRKVWGDYFKDGGPALAMMGIARLPLDYPVEITVTAVTDLSMKKAVRLPDTAADATPDAMIAGDKLYFSNCYGVDASGKPAADPDQQAKLALDRLGNVLKAAGIGYGHVVFVNPYLAGVRSQGWNKVYASYFESGNTPARATISVAHLPNGSAITFTGVAAMDLASRKAIRPKNMSPSPTASPCVFAGDTFYCSAKNAFLPGPNSGIYAETVENQVRMSMRSLLDGLQEAGLTMANVISTNVYMDDMNDFAKMNRIYTMYLKDPMPVRTTIQQMAPVGDRKANERESFPTLEQISLIAVK
jgi:enamine deaminase RidA (YjgF/YER057c/UK114 family)